MRVVHVIPGIGEEASGPSYSVTRLCESLIESGTDVRLAALDWASRTAPVPYLETFPGGIGPRRLGTSPTMRRWLENEAAGGADLIHNHSLWMMPNVYPGWACRRHARCRFVVSPRGTLSAFALGMSALKKRIFWQILQGPALRDVACFHATAESEYASIREAGFRQPICILPNGVDVPPLAERSDRGRRQLLFLGRIHPIKGIDTLLRAWRAVEDHFVDWDLHIAGPDDSGYLSRMRELAAELAVARVTFRGPLYGDAKWRAYRQADVFVLPTHSENFGMAVAESLAAGTPAIVSVAAPWAGLRDQGAGWWIELGVDPLIECLETALTASPQRLAKMGAAGREWMLRDFSWRRTAEQFGATYRWLLHGGSVPAWVREN